VKGSIFDPKAWAALRELGGADSVGLLRSLVEEFGRGGVKLITDLGDAFSSKDAMKVKRIAHTLQGSAANFGASKLMVVCVRLEKAAEDSNWDLMQTSTAELKVSFDEVRTALLEALSREPASI
jgi:HPt (histidine-containing phosphotransfer) domain-containing protein